MDFTDVLIGIFLNPWFLLSLAFWTIILGLVYTFRNRKEAVYVFFPMIALLKTKKLNNFIKKLAKKKPKSWRVFWNIGIFVSFAFSIFAMFFFFINLIALIFNPQVENAVTPLIPGVTIDIPLFMYLILPILFVMTTHELAHGIAASVDGVDIKSTGVMGAGFFYLIGLGAFVEVDERELNSRKFSRNTRLRIAGAGTYVNAITAGVAFILILIFPLLISPFYGPQVIQVDTVLTEDQGGFNQNNIDPGDVIVALKEKGSSQDFKQINGDEGVFFSDILDNKTDGYRFSPGDEVTLKIYNPSSQDYSEKDIVLGPRYDLGIVWEYPTNDELKITYIYDKDEDGVNYNKDLEVDLIITEVNGTEIDVEDGDTLEKLLVNFNLSNVLLTSEDGENFLLDVEVDGVFIGMLSAAYWIPANFIGQIFTGNFPSFLLREFLWLWIIAFSVTLFNMLPLPVFDGDRILKELINWRVGEDFQSKRRKIDKIRIEKDENEYHLSEYRVENVENVKIVLKEDEDNIKRSEITLSEQKFALIDKYGDGFKSTLILDLPEKSESFENAILSVEYEYWFDEKNPVKKKILNTVRIITLAIVGGNFLLSFLKFGALTFWI